MRVFIFALCMVVTGCSSTGSVSRPNSYYDDQTSEAEQARLSQESPLSQELPLSDKKLNQLLDYRVKLRPINRIALHRLRSSSDYDRLPHLSINQAVQVDVIEKIRSADSVYDVSMLPSLLLPTQSTTQNLRSAAARSQADLILIYKDRCADYDKRSLFADSKTHVYCTVESVLMDVRSGLVIFTGSASERVAAAEAEDDVSFYETKNKAEYEAVVKSLVKIAQRLTIFLNQSISSREAS